MIELKCECCGRTFNTRYFEGGYIDHVENFAENRYTYLDSKDPVKKFSEKILFDWNRLRQPHIIREFLSCFMEWDCVSDDIKHKVNSIVEDMLLEINDAKREAIKLEKTISPIILATLKNNSRDVAYFYEFENIVNSNK